jgi:predicted RNA binding protein YcfA (HicA-like mRNA interferase family)
MVVIVLTALLMVVIIHTMKSAALIRQLTKEGWTLDRVAGSHHIFKHPTKPGHISVPHPKADLGKGLIHKLLKQAGLK